MSQDHWFHVASRATCVAALVFGQACGSRTVGQQTSDAGLDGSICPGPSCGDGGDTGKTGQAPDGTVRADAPAVDAHDMDAPPTDAPSMESPDGRPEGSSALPDGGAGGLADAADGSGGAATPTLTVETFCQLLLNEACDWVGEHLAFADCTQWPMFASLEVGCLATPRSVAEGRLAFDGVSAAECIDLIHRKGGPAVGALRGSEEPCGAVFTGQVPVGGSCITASLGSKECSEGICSLQSGCPGRCITYRRLGESCGGTDETCDPTTLFCDVDTCVLLRAAGAGCTSAVECQRDLDCREIGGVQQCAPFPAAGDDCALSSDCGFSLVCVEGKCANKVPSGGECVFNEMCPDGEVCIGASGGSNPRCGEPHQAGAECTQDAECIGDLACRYDDGLTRFICRSLAGPSEPCPREDLCEEGLVCLSDGVCYPPGETDDPCAANDWRSCVPGLFCDRETRTCQPPRGEGQRCTPLYHDTCEKGLYCACDGKYCSTITDLEQTSPTEVCLPLVDNGGECQHNGQCRSSHCDAGRCVSLPRAGYCY